jgi:MFS family permease
VALTGFNSVTYPFGIFSSTIISQLNPNNTLIQNIGYGTVVNCFYLPGCLVGGLLMDRIGRKQTMTLGKGFRFLSPSQDANLVAQGKS